MLAPTTAPARGDAHAPTRPARRRRGPLAAIRRHSSAWLFLAPALILFLLFKFIPMIRAIIMSFQKVQPYLGNQNVGLANYRDLFASSQFGTAVWHTVLLAVVQTGGSMLVGLVLALLLEGTAKHLWFIRTAVFLPTVTAMAVVATLWKILYFPGADGPLNSLLHDIGLGPSQFIASPHTALASVFGVGIWRSAPYDMMIFLAGLAGIDRTLYEAAEVDGATTWQRLWRVTFPGLRPVFGIVLTLAAIRGLRVFTEIFLLTNGGPNGSTDVVMTLIYSIGLDQNNLGLASAGAMVLLVATVILTLIAQYVRRRGREGAR
jgi:multiple sugar transport system permease protein